MIDNQERLEKTNNNIPASCALLQAATYLNLTNMSDLKV